MSIRLYGGGRSLSLLFVFFWESLLGMMRGTV